MREHEARFVIERARKRGRNALRAVREHLGISREVLAARVQFDPRCLAACEDHEGVAMPDIRFRHALARCLGVPADLLFEPRRRSA